ncbi:MAG: GvpL/GvpF family gas vesicle protein [Catenulispora sp.]
MSELGIYLYAISAAPHHAGAGPTLTGIGGSPVCTVTESDLVAYVSDVPLAEFGEESLRERLEDLAWLEDVARAHNDVVEALSRRAPTVPVRLATIYHSHGHVRRFVRGRRSDLEMLLKRLTGRTEWGVKAYSDVRRESTPPTADGTSGERPGTAYLRLRQSRLHADEESRREALRRADRIHSVLLEIAVHGRRHRLQGAQLTDRKVPMVLNAAYLVDEKARADFHAAVAALREPGVEIEVTGPWAPYSFVDLGAGDPDPADVVPA